MNCSMITSKTLLATLFSVCLFLASQWSYASDGDYKLVLMGIVLEKTEQSPMHSVTVNLLETKSNQISIAETTQDGRFYFQLDVNKEYQLYASGQNGTTGEVKTITTYNKNNPEVLNVILTLQEDYPVETFEIEHMKNYTLPSNYYELPSEDVLTYKVQIGAYSNYNEFDNDNLIGIEAQFETEKAPNGAIRYLVGEYERYEDAVYMRHLLRDHGFQESQIVAYSRGERLTIPAIDAAKAYRNY